jgi:hypothetical protein
MSFPLFGIHEVRLLHADGHIAPAISTTSLPRCAPLKTTRNNH